MSDEQKQHLEDIIRTFTVLCATKYKKGQEEHGGDLWKKKGLIDMAIDEAIDQVVYLYTLKQQLETNNIELGTIDEAATTGE